MRNSKLKWSCYCIAVSLCVLTSCRKEDIPLSPDTEVQHNTTLTEVKGIYNQIGQTPLFPAFLLNGKSKLTFPLTPEWESAVKSTIEDVSRYEIPLNGTDDFLFAIESNLGFLPVKTALIIEVNEQAGLARQFVVTLIGSQSDGKVNYSSNKATFRGIMAVSTLSGNLIRGFYYGTAGRTDVVFGESESILKPITQLYLGKHILTKSQFGQDYHDDFCGVCENITRFYGSVCTECGYWKDQNLPGIVVTPKCPEHDYGCLTCFNFCRWHNVLDCPCEDPNNPNRPPIPDGGGSTEDTGESRRCPECGEMNCPVGEPCPNFPPVGGGGGGGNVVVPDPIPQHSNIPFTFSDLESSQRASGVFLRIMNTNAGANLVNLLASWGISIQYDYNTNHVASYGASNRTLMWGEQANEVVIFHELVHALQHKAGINYVSNRMNREVEAFVGMYRYAKKTNQEDLLPGNESDWDNGIGPYLSNPTEENYMRVIQFIIDTNPKVYSGFSENPQHRNTNNINSIFNGN